MTTPSLRGATWSGHPARAASVARALPSTHGPDRRPEQPRQPEARARRHRPVRLPRAGSRRIRSRAGAFHRIAGNERRHAEVWANKLRELGADVPDAQRPRARVRFIILLARLFGTKAVTDLVIALEGDEEDAYDAQESPEVAAIAADEREHARIWDELREGGAPGVAALPPNPEATAAVMVAGRDGVALARRAAAPSEIGAAENWHRTGARSGTLRAVIFGVSDGLVSNLSLVMGVAGAATPPSRGSSCSPGSPASSPARSAWPPASTSRCRASASSSSARSPWSAPRWRRCPTRRRPSWPPPTDRRGSPPRRPPRIAHRIFQDPETALDTLVREELGLDPDQLGSPIGAAGGSFLAFAIGAIDPGHPVPVRRRDDGPRDQPGPQPGRRCSRSAPR